MALKCLLDSGSGVSIISKHVLKKLKLQIILSQKDDLAYLIAANGTQLHIMGRCEIKFMVSGLQMSHSFYVCDKLSEHMLFGRDLLKANNAIIDYQKGIVTFHELVTATIHKHRDTNSYAKIAQTICIPGYSEYHIPVTCHKSFCNQDIMIEPIAGAQWHKFAVGRSLNNTTTGKLHCLILNPHEEGLVLRKGQKVATVSTVNVKCDCIPFSSVQQQSTEIKPSFETQSESQLSDEFLQSFHEDYQFNINPALQNDQKRQLLLLLYKYRTVFARNISELGRYQKFELEANIIDKSPQYQRPYPLRPNEKQEVLRQVKELHAQGLIEPSDSHDYNVPLFLIAKRPIFAAIKGQDDPKTNAQSWRLICDFRKVNKCIKMQPARTERITDIINQISSAKPTFYSSYDMMHGFYQCGLKPGITRDITTFTTPDNQKYRWTVAPFGYSCSPHALNHILNVELGQLVAGEHLSIYVDDFIQYHSDWQSHIQDIEQLLKKLKDCNLTLNSKKSHFAATEISYIGFRLNSDGVSLDPARIQVVKDMTAPKDRKGVQRLMGFLQYLKKFIASFSQKSYNIRQLLSDSVKFHWGPEEQLELDYFKEALSNPPVLAPIQTDREWHVITDSSAKGCGYILCQLFDSNGPGSKQVLRPIAYGSKACTKSMESWSSCDLELYGVSIALREWERYLIGHKVNVWSDNIGVVYLDKLCIGSHRHKRMLAYIQQFDLTVRYLSGKLNAAADHLSRLDFSQAGTRVKFKNKADDDFIFAVCHSNDTTSLSNDSRTAVTERATHSLTEITDLISRPISSSGEDASTPTVLAWAPPLQQQHADTSNGRKVTLTTTQSQHACTVAPPINGSGDNDLEQLNDLITDSTDSTVKAINMDHDLPLSDNHYAIQLNDNLIPAVDRSIYKVNATKKTVRHATSNKPITTDTPDENNTVTITGDDPLHATFQFTEPIMTRQDIEQDPEFGPLFRYLAYDELTGDQKTDYKTLLLHSDFVI